MLQRRFKYVDDFQQNPIQPKLCPPGTQLMSTQSTWCHPWSPAPLDWLVSFDRPPSMAIAILFMDYFTISFYIILTCAFGWKVQSIFDLNSSSSSPHPHSEGYLHPLGNVHRGDNFELRHLYWGCATHNMKDERWRNLNWIKWATSQAYGLEDLVAEKVFWLPNNVSFLFPVLHSPF